MILKDSRPKIINNQITDNDGIGLYIRDKSHGIIKLNVVRIYQNNRFLFEFCLYLSKF